MRKKVEKMVSFLLAMTLILGLSLSVSGQKVKAAEELQEEVGYTDIQTRGIYLQSGSSKISQPGAGKITVGGTTRAQKVVDTVSINVNVERKVNGTWEQYTSWTVTKHDTISVTTSKTLSVPKGYYYRVKSVHYANSDVSSSATGGLYV
ncbi:MAG: DUF6147 family protein [Sellimonas sp.]|uniref:DUF6147 family protein n=1 Tax=Sellimonas sp. TaxID=2021466 RepID=UPI0039A02D1B